MKWILATGTAAALLAGVGAANAQMNWQSNNQGYQRGQMMERNVGLQTGRGWNGGTYGFNRAPARGQFDLQLERIPFAGTVAAIASGRWLLTNKPDEADEKAPQLRGFFSSQEFAYPSARSTAAIQSGA